MKMQAAAATAQIPAQPGLAQFSAFHLSRALHVDFPHAVSRQTLTHTHTINVETAVNQFPTELL